MEATTRDDAIRKRHTRAGTARQALPRSTPPPLAASSPRQALPASACVEAGRRSRREALLPATRLLSGGREPAGARAAREYAAEVARGNRAGESTLLRQPPRVRP